MRKIQKKEEDSWTQLLGGCGLRRYRLNTANERSYLNSIGKEMEFGVNDYDYFFELFGVPSERRSGVYTANLEQGRIWTEDEEGNHFIIYANGDSTEKLSVSKSHE